MRLGWNMENPSLVLSRTPPRLMENLMTGSTPSGVAFDSEDELLRGQGAWKGKDDLTMTWSTMYDAETFYFAAAVRSLLMQRVN